MTEEEIGHAIIGAAMRVHSVVGPGLLESAYEVCLAYELEKKNCLRVRKQVIVPIRYAELTIDDGYRIDLLVENLVVVELKAVAAILPVHRGQLLSVQICSEDSPGCCPYRLPGGGRDLCQPWAPASAGVTRFLMPSLTFCSVGESSECL